MSDPSAPGAPADPDGPPVPPAIAGSDDWELVETVSETREEYALVTVRVRRALYGDRALRDCVADATGHDRLWRSFFASRLRTTPALTPGLAGPVLDGIAVPAAKRRLVEDLESRGFQEVRERDGRRLTVGEGERARATEFATAIPLDDGTVRAAAWLAVWERDGAILVGGGIYPVEAPAGATECFAGADRYRRELVDAIRAIE